MSHRSGDRARADKQATKRRARRLQMRPLVKAVNDAKPKAAARISEEKTVEA